MNNPSYFEPPRRDNLQPDPHRGPAQLKSSVPCSGGGGDSVGGWAHQHSNFKLSVLVAMVDPALNAMHEEVADLLGALGEKLRRRSIRI